MQILSDPFKIVLYVYLNYKMFYDQNVLLALSRISFVRHCQLLLLNAKRPNSTAVVPLHFVKALGDNPSLLPTEN